MMMLTDLAAVAEIAHQAGALFVVDNTFASPYFQNPIALGADIVFHSATKYLGGHSDLVHGVVVVANEDLGNQMHFIQNGTGGVPSPFDCWLCLRSAKTLAVRMERHAANAMALARYCETHPKVKKVYYPGLESHPQHELAKRQMRGFGGMLSLELESTEVALSFAKKVQVFTLAESLGGVESLLCYPETMTHASIPEPTRRRLGITPALVRLSVGIEDVDDLLADVEQALSA
jgi:cystathionine beta-lyase/cystathionine gamma-synthase